MPGGAAGELASLLSISAALAGAGVDLHVSVLIDDLAAGSGDQGVYPNGQALVLGGLHLDGLAVLGGLVDHLVPGEVVGRWVDLVLAVPEQLRVAGEGDAVDLAVVVHGLERALQPALLGRLAALALPGLDPACLGQLGGPDHVHADQVDAVILGREPPHDQLALLVGVVRQLHVVDLVLAAGLLVAVGHGLVERPARLVEDVPVDRAGAACRPRRRRLRSPPRARTQASPPARSACESSRSCHPRRSPEGGVPTRGGVEAKLGTRT